MQMKRAIENKGRWATDRRYGFKLPKKSIPAGGMTWPTMDHEMQAEWERRYQEDDWAGIPFWTSWVVATALATHGMKRKEKTYGNTTGIHL